jgi:Domain of unknown function (DUF932)
MQKPLTLDALRAIPSKPGPMVTDKYAFIDTRRVTEMLMEQGYELYDVQVPNFRNPHRVYGLHMLDFRRPDDMEKGLEEAPRLLFMNSYNGQYSARFMAGIIRFACANGLIIGKLTSNERYVHKGLEPEDVYKEVAAAADQSMKAMDRIEQLKGIVPTPQRLLRMAREGLELRYPDKAVRPNVAPSALLEATRPEDERNDIYTKWNIMQEKLMVGGTAATTAGNARNTRTQALSHIARRTQLNTQLWELLERHADRELAKAA